MSLSLSIAIYFIVWWVTLFAILPLRLGSVQDETDTFAVSSGAPSSPRLGLKFIITTMVSAVIFAAIYVIYTYKLLTLDDFPF